MGRKTIFPSNSAPTSSRAFSGWWSKGGPHVLDGVAGATGDPVQVVLYEGGGRLGSSELAFDLPQSLLTVGDALD